MDYSLETLDKILQQTRHVVRASLWMEKTVWESCRTSLQAIWASHELLERGEKDLARFRSLGCALPDPVSSEHVEAVERNG